MLCCPCIVLHRDLFIENTATKFLPHLSHTKNDGTWDKGILNKYSGKRFLPKAVKKSQPSTPCWLLAAVRPNFKYVVWFLKQQVRCILRISYIFKYYKAAAVQQAAFLQPVLVLQVNHQSLSSSSFGGCSRNTHLESSFQLMQVQCSILPLWAQTQLGFTRSAPFFFFLLQNITCKTTHNLKLHRSHPLKKGQGWLAIFRILEETLPSSPSASSFH